MTTKLSESDSRKLGYVTALNMDTDNDYITKPVKLKQLRETIQHLIATANNN